MRCRLTPLDANEDIQLDNAEDSVPTEIPSVPTVIPADYTNDSEPSDNIENFLGDVESDAKDINPKAYQATDILPKDRSEDAEDIDLEETDEEGDREEDDSEDFSEPQQTSWMLVIFVVAIVFLLGCGVFYAVTQTPFGKQWMQPQNSTPQAPK
jgi:cell division protein FtsX